MRRIFSIGLALLMVLATIGVTINKHYSHGKLFSIALYGNADPCCEMECGCCYEESKTYQVNDDFIPSFYEQDFSSFANQITFAYILNISFFESSNTKEFLEKDKSPPAKFSSIEYSQTFLL